MSERATDDAVAGRTPPDVPSVCVAICTYERNGPLEVLLEAVVRNAERLGPRARVGVAVVDDSHDGKARPVVERFQGRFELGVSYRRSGRQNISIARNLVIDTAAEIADWVAMTDDDCEPVDGWLEALIEMQQRTGADAVSGLYRRRVPDDAPRWLTEEPFLEIALDDREDGAASTQAGTNNSMLSSAWWKAHPEIRFQTDMGVTGGEDMVFYRSAYAAGMRIHYARQAAVFENEPPSRLTLAYQLRLFFWLGNSSYLTRRETGEASPFRMVLQGGNQIVKAVLRSLRRLLRGQSPHLRYALAQILFGVGLLIGPLGIRIAHH